MCPGELEDYKQVNISLQRILTYKTREQNNWTFSGEHGIYFSNHHRARRENKGMDGCLLSLLLWHLALSPPVVAMLLTPHFDVATPQNLLACFRLENEQSSTLVAPERASTLPARREKIFLSLSLCPKWPRLGALLLDNHSVTHHPPLHSTAAQEKPEEKQLSAKMVTPPLWV